MQTLEATLAGKLTNTLSDPMESNWCGIVREREGLAKGKREVAKTVQNCSSAF